MKLKNGIFDSGISNNQVITSNTVYGKFIFFDSKNTKLDVINKNNNDRVQLRNDISSI